MAVRDMGEKTPVSGVEVWDDDATDRLRAAVGRLSRRLRDTKASGGLTPSQVSVLFTVARRGPIAVSELAEIEAMNPTMLSRITTQLSALGLITRERRPDDRRSATLLATAAGRRLRESVHLERTRVLSRYVGGLAEADRTALLAAIPALEILADLAAERIR